MKDNTIDNRNGYADGVLGVDQQDSYLKAMKIITTVQESPDPR